MFKECQERWQQKPGYKHLKSGSSSSSSSLGILCPPRSGALALPHNVDVKVKCSWAANLGEVSKVQITLLAIALLNNESTDALVRLKKGALPI